MSDSHANIVIIGAGPTGLSAAWRLQELGFESWELFDSSYHAGGLAASVTDSAGFTWDMGGHVLFSHYEYFDQLLDNLLHEWQEHVREAWVWMRDRFIPYPLQNNIWRLPPEDIATCLAGLRSLQSEPAERATQAEKSFYEWILNSFGQGMADVFFVPYNTKVWAYHPTQLSANWVNERVATIDLGKILRNLELQQDDLGWGPNSKFKYPRHGGNGAIWRQLCKRLPAEKVKLGQKVVAVRANDRCIILENGRRFPTTFCFLLFRWINC